MYSGLCSSEARSWQNGGLSLFLHGGCNFVLKMCARSCHMEDAILGQSSILPKWHPQAPCMWGHDGRNILADARSGLYTGSWLNNMSWLNKMKLPSILLCVQLQLKRKGGTVTTVRSRLSHTKAIVNRKISVIGREHNAIVMGYLCHTRGEMVKMDWGGQLTHLFSPEDASGLIKDETQQGRNWMVSIKGGRPAQTGDARKELYSSSLNCRGCIQEVQRCH